MTKLQPTNAERTSTEPSCAVGNGAHAPTESKGATETQLKQRMEILAQLRRHPDLDASRIEVTVNEGKVMLSGSVSDAEMKQLAETIADGVPGVKDVRNELATLFDRAAFELGA